MRIYALKMGIKHIYKSSKHHPCPVWVVLCSSFFPTFILVKPKKSQTEQQTTKTTKKKASSQKISLELQIQLGPTLCGGVGTTAAKVFLQVLAGNSKDKQHRAGFLWSWDGLGGSL